jgi:hypothetical protein
MMGVAACAFRSGRCSRHSRHRSFCMSAGWAFVGRLVDSFKVQKRHWRFAWRGQMGSPVGGLLGLRPSRHVARFLPLTSSRAGIVRPRHGHNQELSLEAEMFYRDMGEVGG